MKKDLFKVVELHLGSVYKFYHSNTGTSKDDFMFIKVTNKGYNFLNLRTNECILNRHIYQGRKLDGNNYFIRKYLFPVLKTD